MKFNAALVLLASSMVAKAAVIDSPARLSRRGSINLGGIGRTWGWGSGSGSGSSDSDRDESIVHNSGPTCADDGFMIHHQRAGCKKGDDGNGTPTKDDWTLKDDWCWLAKKSSDTDRLRCYLSDSTLDDLTDDITCLSTKAEKHGGCSSG